jgi:TolB protein
MEEPPPNEEFQPALDGDEAAKADTVPVMGPGQTHRRLRIAITLVVVAAFVMVFGLGLGIRVAPTVIHPRVSETFQGPAAIPRIAVVDANGALSSMHADGGSVFSYQAPDVTFQFPAWSPNGAQIAAIGTDDVGGGAGVYVFAAPVDGSGTAPPTVPYRGPAHPAFYLYWAPNSKALAFLTTEPDGIALREATADAAAPDTVIRNGAPMYWQWVDPTHLLVHSGGNAPEAFVGEVGLDGVQTEPKAIQAGLFRAPALSGDGAYLAYATPGVGGTAAVVLESRDGRTHHEVPVFGPAALEFDPAGNALAFLAPDKAGASADLPVGPLRAVDPASGAVRTLLGGSIIAFFWAPDGRTIAALRVNEPGDTNVASRAGPVVTLTRAGTPAAQTAAGVLLNVVFVDVDSGFIRSERVGRLSDLFVSQVLPYFDQYALSHRVWSPDGTSIVLPIDDDQGVSQLTIVPADGSGARQLVAGAMGFWSP